MIRPSDSSAEPLLSASGLYIARGERQLVSGLDLSVAPGQALLLRGPNGVGKSTLLLALARIVRPLAGVISGAGPAEQHFLGYQHGLKLRLTVTENLAFWRHMHGPTGLGIEAALEEVGISPLADLEAGYLSSGQLRRLSLARLLVSSRPLWLLDEPSAALDAAGETLLGRIIDTHLAAGGGAVIATHHDLPISAGHTATLHLGAVA